MARRFRFKKLPPYARVSITARASNTSDPREMYEYATAYRSVYTRALPMNKKVSTDGALPVEEWKQIHGIPQALLVNLVLSCEVLLKAIILSSTGKLERGHSLKSLLNKLDSRHRAYIENHLVKNGLTKSKWNKVIKDSDKIFEVARYGYEGKEYTVDFITLQLINEALDDVYNEQVPEWPDVNNIVSTTDIDRERQIKVLLDKAFDPPEIDEFTKALIRELK